MSGTSGRAQIRHVALTYATYYAAAGLHHPYFPLWLKRHGLSEGEIAVVLSLPQALRVLAVPGFSRIADRLGSPAILLRLLSFAFLAGALLLGRMDGFWPILIVAAPTLVLWQGCSPLLDATALNLVRRGIAADYGRLRLWGSISFIGASLGGGFLLAQGGPDLVFLAFTGAALAVTLTAIALGRAMRTGRPAPAAASTPQSRGVFLAVILAAALIQASHMAFNAFGSIHLARLGHADTTVGFLWAVAAVSEIGMFWAGPQIARRVSALALLAIAAAVASLRWGFLAGGGDLAWLVLLQITQAATFGGTNLGVMRFIAEAVPESRGASAQGTYMTVFSLVSAGATLAFGRIYELYAGGVFLAAAALPLVSLALLAVVHSRRERRP